MEVWDAYLANGTLAHVDLIRGEPIPRGLFHLVCEVLVRHQDGDYLIMQRDWGKASSPGGYEATAGGSALKGESGLVCIERELWEETGIKNGVYEFLDRFVYPERGCIFNTYLCTTDCDKDRIILQRGETIAYHWLTEWQFRKFIDSDFGIQTQKQRYIECYRDLNLIEN